MLASLVTELGSGKMSCSPNQAIFFSRFRFTADAAPSGFGKGGDTNSGSESVRQVWLCNLCDVAAS